MSVDISYYSFNPERADKGWEGFSADIAAAREMRGEGAVESGLTPAREYLRDCLEELDNPELVAQHLVYLDLLYGGVSNVASFFEESERVMEQIPYVLIKEFGLAHEDDVPLRSGLIDFYEKLEKEDLEKLQKIVVKKFYGGEDGENLVPYGLEFLQSLKPVVKDLRDNPRSILVYVHDGNFEPKSAEKILMGRAGKHVEAYKKL